LKPAQSRGRPPRRLSPPSSRLPTCFRDDDRALDAPNGAFVDDLRNRVRATLFPGTVSGGLVALAFLGQVSADSAAFHLFALVVLPALLILGVLTHMRLVELATARSLTTIAAVSSHSRLRR
jgi:hypothetical protein